MFNHGVIIRRASARRQSSSSISPMRNPRYSKTGGRSSRRPHPGVRDDRVVVAGLQQRTPENRLSEHYDSSMSRRAACFRQTSPSKSFGWTKADRRGLAHAPGDPISGSPPVLPESFLRSWCAPTCHNSMPFLVALSEKKLLGHASASPFWRNLLGETPSRRRNSLIK